MTPAEYTIQKEYPDEIDGLDRAYWLSRPIDEVVDRMFQLRHLYLTVLEALSYTLPKEN